MRAKIIGMMFLITLAVTVSAQAATFTVINTLDDNNPGSLRWAINQANANPDFDTIEFHIPSANPNDPPQKQSIQMTEPLPDIISSVLIDGWSQMGMQSVNVELRGLNTNMLSLGSNIEVRGLSVGFIHGHQEGNYIHHNYIGLGLDGESNIGPYAQGVLMGNNSVISDNVIAHFDVDVLIYGGNQTIIKRNVIGLTLTGNQTQEQNIGIILVNASGVVIGGDISTDRNVIAGQNLGFGGGSSGIILGNSEKVVIKNNYIGLSIDGMFSATGGSSGIVLGSGSAYKPNRDVLIEGNIIAGFNGAQIYGNYDNLNIQIKKNIIGLNIDGYVVNGQDEASGIFMRSTKGLVIGGDEIDRNIIGGLQDGIMVWCGVDIKNNYIGVGLDGSVKRKNKKSGIHIYECPDVIQNVENNILANNLSGIQAEYWDGISGDVTIRNNRISYNYTGIGFSDFQNVKVFGNLITNNKVGVHVNGDSYGVEILNNSIYDNDSGGSLYQSLGIDLGSLGFVNINDANDGDEGANHFLNYPFLKSAIADSHFIAVKLRLDIDRPTALVQFFANSQPDPSGHGEGEIFLGEQQVPGDNSFYTAILPIPSGMDPELIQNISATATAVFDGMGNTSEFSNTVEVHEGVVPLDFGDAPDPGPGTGVLNYQTTFADGGPYHVFDENLFLGTCVDADPGTLQDQDASYDDKIVGMIQYGKCKSGDDEDGVVLPAQMFSGQLAELSVNVTSSPSSSVAYLNIWIDYNKNGKFSDVTEHVVTNQSVTSGINAVSFVVPQGLEGPTFLRARLTRQLMNDNDASVGMAQNGEVEDYSLRIIPNEGIDQRPQSTTKWSPYNERF